MPTLFVTKWVLARGIIVAEGERHNMSWRQTRELYEVKLPGHRWQRVLMTLGSDAFLTMEEARKYAGEIFQKQVQDQVDALEAAQEALRLYRSGKLQVHENPINIREVYAFGRPLLPRDNEG